jgi:hypothetical protein
MGGGCNGQPSPYPPLTTTEFLSLCPGGDTVKLLGPPKASPTTLQPERAVAEPGITTLGTVTTEGMSRLDKPPGGNEMGNQQPSP